MELNVYRTKFKLLFDKLFHNNFELDNYYEECLIKCLENNSDKDVNKLLESPFFIDLLIYALSNINQTTESVRIFIVNLTTLVTRNELQFSKLLHLKGLYIIDNINAQNVSSIHFKVACIRQATVQIQHTSGLYWVIERQIWQQIFNSCYQTHRQHVVRAAYTFLSKFIRRLNELEDETNLRTVLAYILNPILSSNIKDVQNITPELEKAMIAQVTPSIMTFLTLLTTEGKAKNMKIVHMLTRYFLIDPHLYCYVDATRETEFVSMVGKLSFLLSCVASQTNHQQLQEEEFAIEGVSYFNLLYSLIQKRKASVVIEFSIETILYWSKYGKQYGPTSFLRYGRIFSTDIQMVIILLVPLVFYTSPNPFGQDPKHENGLTNYILKLGEITAEQIIKACYMFKDLIIGDINTKEVVIMTLKKITRLKGHLNNDQASTLFQALFYVLKKHVPTDSSGSLVLTETSVKSMEDATLLSLVIDNIKLLLKEHDINWYDSCEVICLYNILMNLLKPKTLPTKLVMKALDLINITVKKFLSPDLNLLMESKTGSALNEIGDTIRLGLMDEEWEVRDSAMQLLLTCTELSFVKYIPFQKLISANSLIAMAASAACADPEYYVQAAALRCVAAASRVECVWKETLCAHPKIYVQLTYLAQQHPEGIVRKEAVAALTEITVNQKVTEEFSNLMHIIMYNAALKDLHWETQLTALTFWRKDIQNQLSYRGMIDGKFPSMTFSKEKRKIITLNQEEIHKQLISLLNSLAQNGCLSVLCRCISEDYNIKVMEQAYVVAKELLEILDKYNLTRVPDAAVYFPFVVANTVVPEHSISQPNCGLVDECMPMDLSYSYNNVSNADRVIDDIVESNSADLVQDLYENYVGIKMEEADEEIFRSLTGLQVIHPNEFLEKFRSGDISSVIEYKKNWNSGLRDLHSILDEIISLNGGSCYIQPECS